MRQVTFFLGAALLALTPIACTSTGETDSRAADAVQPVVPRPDIIPAEAWGSDPLPFPEGYHHEPRTVLIHHSGVLWREGTNPFNRMKNLQKWGKNERDWMDVPYHFLIAPNGQIFEGRPVRYRPDTNTDFDTSGFVNVELMGSFGVQRVSEPQLRSAVAVSAWLASEYDMDPESFATHRDVASTNCPGEDLYRYVQGGPFRDWVLTVMQGDSPDIELLPPLEGGPEEMLPDIQELWAGPN